MTSKSNVIDLKERKIKKEIKLKASRPEEYTCSKHGDTIAFILIGKTRTTYSCFACLQGLLTRECCDVSENHEVEQ